MSDQAAPSPGAMAASNPPAVAPGARRGRIPILLGALALLGAGGFGVHYALVGRHIVATDDAYVKADTTVIAAKVSGHIAAVLVRDNQRVARGDLLLRIDDGDYKLAEDAAREKVATQEATIGRLREQTRAQEAAIRQAEAQIEAAQADLRRAEAGFLRTSTLASTNFSSAATLDSARADRDRAQAVLVGARAALDSARAASEVLKAQRIEAEKLRGELETALDKARRDRSFTEIRAPFAGIIGNRAAQVGALAQSGTRLLALVPLESVYVEANFKETQLANLRPGQKVSLRVDANSGRSIEGRLGSIAPATGAQFSLLPPDNATGNFTKVVQRVPVRVEIPAAIAAEGWIRPGLSVVAEVHTGRVDERNADRASR